MEVASKSQAWPKKSKPKKTVGRREIVDFPLLGLIGIEAKVDTGAYTSALHCQNVRLIETGGAEFVTFHPLDPTHPEFEEKELVIPLKQKKFIKNSFGQIEDRFVIMTEIIIFGKTLPIELTLADRSLMDYPVLLGRKLLQNGFVVDVTKLHRSHKRKLKGLK